MSTKRKVSLPPRSVDTGPKERAQHGAMVAESDPNVAGFVRVRAIPVVEKLFKDEKIGHRELRGAEAFWWCYMDAQVGPRYAKSSFVRVDRSPETEMSMRTVLARAQLRNLEALIGRRSMRILELVVGQDRSLQETGAEISQGGQSWDHKNIRSALQTVLPVVANYYRC